MGQLTHSFKSFSKLVNPRNHSHAFSSLHCTYMYVLWGKRFMVSFILSRKNIGQTVNGLEWVF